jgi:hypothetical protein
MEPKMTGRVVRHGWHGFFNIRENVSMTIASRLRALAAAALAIASVGLVAAPSVAKADSGAINFRVFKAGFIVGGQGGSGSLIYQGRRYPISIGGLSYGLTFGASETRFTGTVTNIRRPSDVAGVYGAAGAGAAVGRGAQGIVLTNNKGAVLTLTGRQAGLIVSADLSGMVVTMR